MEHYYPLGTEGVKVCEHPQGAKQTLGGGVGAFAEGKREGIKEWLGEAQPPFTSPTLEHNLCYNTKPYPIPKLERSNRDGHSK